MSESKELQDVIALQIQCVESLYEASSIRILKDQEVTERFDWAKATALSIEYGRDPHWIERGLAACQAAGVSADYFIRRYLQQDLSVAFHEGVDAAFREMWLEKVVHTRMRS